MALPFLQNSPTNAGILGILSGMNDPVIQVRGGGSLSAPGVITPGKPVVRDEPGVARDIMAGLKFGTDVARSRETLALEREKTRAAIEAANIKRRNEELRRSLDRQKYELDVREFEREGTQRQQTVDARVGVLQDAQDRGIIPETVPIGLLAEDDEAFEQFAGNVLFPNPQSSRAVKAMVDGTPTFVSPERAVAENLQPMPSSALVSIPPGEKKSQTMRVERGFKLLDETQEKAALAQEAQVNIEQLRDAFALAEEEGFETGALADIRMFGQKLGNLMGFNFEGVGEAESGEALAKQMALQLRNPKAGAGMPGQLSNADRDFLRQMVPGIQTTKEGREIILDAWTARNNRMVEIADMADEYMDRTGKDYLDNDFRKLVRDYNRENPIFTDLNRRAQELRARQESGEEQDVDKMSTKQMLEELRSGR